MPRRTQSLDITVLSLILLLITQLFGASAFAPTTNRCIGTHTFSSIWNHKTISTALFGTIRFKGTAQAELTASPPPRGQDQIDYKNSNITISDYLSSSKSDAILLGMKGSSGGGVAEVKKIKETEGSSTWECRQGSIDWFGMTLIPIFINVIERSEFEGSSGEGTVVISIIDAKTQVENGGRFGNTLGSAMKRSVFEGRNVIFWKDEGDSYTLEGNIELSLTINLPPFLPLPPGFNRIGSMIVERTCRERLRQNLRDVSDAYTRWANLQFVD